MHFQKAYHQSQSEYELQCQLISDGVQSEKMLPSREDNDAVIPSAESVSAGPGPPTQALASRSPPHKIGECPLHRPHQPRAQAVSALASVTKDSSGQSRCTQEFQVPFCLSPMSIRLDSVSVTLDLTQIEQESSRWISLLLKQNVETIYYQLKIKYLITNTDRYKMNAVQRFNNTTTYLKFSIRALNISKVFTSPEDVSKCQKFKS